MRPSVAKNPSSVEVNRQGRQSGPTATSDRSATTPVIPAWMLSAATGSPAAEHAAWWLPQSVKLLTGTNKRPLQAAVPIASAAVMAKALRLPIAHPECLRLSPPANVSLCTLLSAMPATPGRHVRYGIGPRSDSASTSVPILTGSTRGSARSTLEPLNPRRLPSIALCRARARRLLWPDSCLPPGHASSQTPAHPHPRTLPAPLGPARPRPCPPGHH